MKKCLVALLCATSLVLVQGGITSCSSDDSSDNNKLIALALANQNSSSSASNSEQNGSSSGSDGNAESENNSGNSGSSSDNKTDGSGDNAQGSGNTNTPGDGGSSSTQGSTQNQGGGGGTSLNTDTSPSAGNKETPSSELPKVTPTTPTIALPASAKIEIIKSEAYNEGACVTWKKLDSGITYNVYCDNKKLDASLVREYPQYMRVDALGLTKGNHTIKIAAVDKTGESSTVTATRSISGVTNFDRSGYAHSNWTKGVGAYNNDGSLKENAIVVYVTAATAKTVTAMIKVDKKEVVRTGVQDILDALQKGSETRPVCVRFIGLIRLGDLDKISSTEEGLQIKGKGALSEMNVTIEGVGDDATIYGFGFLIRNCKSLELRNLGIMYCMDDGVSIDTGNSNIWTHNLDIFYGKAGSGDHAKGDGSLDTKGTVYATHAYNHFWDTGKCSLNSNGDAVNYVTYHHNWYDHSDSRHPRVRMSQALHVYNNYYDGNAKYGIGAAKDCSVFAENNYFRNCKYPMIMGHQGHDTKDDGSGYTLSKESGGIIKAYNNSFNGTYKFTPYGTKTGESTTEFDAYVASSQDEVVPDTVKEKTTNKTYSNFDTKADFYKNYILDTPEDVPSIVKAGAGRLGGGDFKFTFTTADDTSDTVNASLKAKLESYRSTLVSVQQ